MTKLPKLQGLLDKLINPNLKTNIRKNKVLKIINKNEQYLKQYEKELTKKVRKKAISFIKRLRSTFKSFKEVEAV